MKKAPLIVGVIVLLLCIGGYIALHQYQANEEKREEEKTMSPISVSKDDVTALTYVYEGETITLEKNGDTWTCKEDSERDISEETVDSMLETLCTVTADESVDVDNLSDYGFDEPEADITLTTQEGTTTVKYGMYNDILTKYYLSVDGSKTLYLVSGDASTAFKKTLEDLTVVPEESAEESSTEGSATEESSTEGNATEESSVEENNTEESATEEGSVEESSTEENSTEEDTTEESETEDTE